MEKNIQITRMGYTSAVKEGFFTKEAAALLCIDGSGSGAKGWIVFRLKRSCLAFFHMHGPLKS